MGSAQGVRSRQRTLAGSSRPAIIECLEDRLLLSATPDNQNQTPTAWQWYVNASVATLTNATNQGYRITNLTVNPSATPTFNATLVQNTGTYNQAWWWYVNESAQQLSSLTTSLNARITDLEPYVVNGQVEFAALLAPNTGADSKAWWWYYNESPSDIASELTANKARLIDLKTYTLNGNTEYATVMISNTGADARGWFYYLGQTVDQISTLLTQDQARITEIEPADATHFDVIMQQDPGVEWWWYVGQSISSLSQHAQQDGARIFSVEPYTDSQGNSQLAALLINNSDALTTDVGNILRDSSSTASTGFLLKQFNGPVLDSIQPDTQFEPASMIKILLNLTAMRAVQAGTVSLDDPVWMYYDPANPYVSFNQPGNPNENPDSYADTPSNRVSLPLRVILARMMQISDNRATKAIDVMFGRPAINQTAQLAGMTNTVFASTLGSGVPGNFLTLDDASKLFEGVLNNTLLSAPNAAQFFNNMSNEPEPGVTNAIPLTKSIFQPFIDDATQEAASILNLPATNPLVTSLSAAFVARMKGAWKGGSYEIPGGTGMWAEDLTAGGYLAIPSEDASGDVTLSDYTYGIFINNALVPQNPYPNPQVNAVDSAWSTSQGELMRGLIHQALTTWIVNPNLVVTNLNDSGPGSLRAAVQIADNSVGVATITFASGLSGTIHLANPLELSNTFGSTIISGPSGASLLVSGEKQVRVFQVDTGVAAQIDGLTLTNGAATGSGGAILNDGNLQLQNVQIDGSAASEGGGGIYNASGATLLLDHSTVSSNTASFGAGVSDNGNMTAVDSTIADNNASSQGGGVYDSGGATIVNTTIAFNTAPQGGGIDLSGGSATLDNTIVASNKVATLSTVASDVLGAVGSDSSHNLIGTGGSGGLLNGTNGNDVGIADPRLVALTNNGGPTQTIALLPTSPAVDAGSNPLALAYDGSVLTTDQRGQPRIFDGLVDIGAYELQTPLTLISTTFGDGITSNTTQRSEVRTITLVFDRPVALATGAIGLALLNTGGSGLNNGSAPTAIADGDVGSAASPDGGITWIITFAKNASHTDTTGSLQDGIYSLSLNASTITSKTGGATLGAGALTTTFHRLFGDYLGKKTVNNAAYLAFKATYGKSTGQAGFNADFDYFDSGTINNASYLQFVRRYGKLFSY